MSKLFRRKRGHSGPEMAGGLEKKIMNLQKKYNKKFDLEILRKLAHQEKDSLVGDLARCIATSIERKCNDR